MSTGGMVRPALALVTARLDQGGWNILTVMKKGGGAVTSIAGYEQQTLNLPYLVGSFRTAYSLLVHMLITICMQCPFAIRDPHMQIFSNRSPYANRDSQGSPYATFHLQDEPPNHAPGTFLKLCRQKQQALVNWR